MMHSTFIKFLGSDWDKYNECFTAGKFYSADISSSGNYFVYDDNGDTWVIDPDDEDFEFIQ